MKLSIPNAKAVAAIMEIMRVATEAVGVKTVEISGGQAANIGPENAFDIVTILRVAYGTALGSAEVRGGPDFDEFLLAELVRLKEVIDKRRAFELPDTVKAFFDNKLN